MNYVIRIRGRLDEDWGEWFHDMTLTHTSEGHALLSGPCLTRLLFTACSTGFAT
jgi:hypothetical protein